jgi:hypothetical protein
LIGGPFTTFEVHARLRREIDTMNAHKVQYRPVFSLQDHELAGCAGLQPYGSGEDVSELGVHLRPSYWGQGIGVVDHRFDLANVSKLDGPGPLFFRIAPSILDLHKVGTGGYLAIQVCLDLPVVALGVKALVALHIAEQRCVVSAAARAG